MTATCQHGYTGYCYDDATPAQRDEAARLRVAACDWFRAHGAASARTSLPDMAERFAADYVRTSWTGDGLDLSESFPAARERFLSAG